MCFTGCAVYNSVCQCLYEYALIYVFLAECFPSLTHRKVINTCSLSGWLVELPFMVWLILFAVIQRDQVVYNRLRIGHSYPAHSYLTQRSSTTVYTLSLSFIDRAYSHRMYWLLQIYLNFFTRYIALLYYSTWKMSICIRSYNS